MRKNLFDEEEEATQFQNDDEEFWNQYIQHKKNNKNFSGHYNESAADATEHELTGIDENTLSVAYAKAEEVLLKEDVLRKTVEKAVQSITEALDNNIEPEIARSITLDTLRTLIDEAKF